MDQSLRNAGVRVSRITSIVARIASPDRSGRMNFAPVSVREFGLGRRYRPHKARQLTRHRDADLVDLHAAGTQPSEASSEPQLCFPGHVSDRLWQVLRALLRPAADTRLEAVVPCRLGEQPPRMRIAGLGDAAADYPLTAGMLRRHQTQIRHQLARVRKASD